MKLIIFFTALVGFTACTNSKPKIEGKIFYTVSRDNIKSADPTMVYDEPSGDVIYQIYEGLYQYDYYSDHYSISPQLADGMPKISPDKKTYTIKIKKGVHFQNDPCFKATNGKGREVKAQDFIYAWKRHANPKIESMGFWIFDGKFVGINDFRKNFEKMTPEEAMKQEVEGMKALDDYTIQIKLTKPYPQLVYAMTMTFIAPIPHEVDEVYGKDFATHPVGTGPFRATEWQPTSRIVMVKNENFREETFPAPDKLGKNFKHLSSYSGKKLPLVDGIIFQVLKEDQPRWLGFLSGKYDQIKIPKDNFAAAIQNETEVTPELKQKGIGVSIEQSLVMWYVSLNLKDSVLGKNKLLRQAIASAVDRKGWLEIFKNGRGAVQTEVSPPEIAERCGKPYRWPYDIKKAKELLARAGFPEGKGLPVFHYDTRSTELADRQLAEFISKNLAQIGIKTEIIANTFPAYIDKWMKGNLQISKGGWNYDYPDAENGYQLLFGPFAPPGPNEANFKNAKYDELFEKMALLPPGSERKSVICKMEEIIQEEVPWAYGIYENEYRLTQPWLKNYRTAELVFNKYKYLDITPH